MIFKFLLIIFIIFLIKLFVLKFDFHDYFNVILSLLYLFLSYLYIISNHIFLIILIIITALILIFYSFLKLDTNDNSIIIVDGCINFKNMYKNNYSITSLLNDLKTNNIRYLNNNLFAILKNKKLLLYSKEVINNKPLSIIIDGNICINELYLIGKNKYWLNKRVEENNCKIDNIFYSFYYNNTLYIIKK